VDSIEVRLAALEKSNRRLKALALGMALAAVVFVAWGQASVPDEITAKSFELLNDKGELVISMAASAEGARFAAFNNEGKLGALIAVSSIGGIISTFGEGNQTVDFGYDDRGNGSLTIYDRRGVDLLNLGASKSGEPLLSAYNRAGKPKAQWP